MLSRRRNQPQLRLQAPTWAGEGGVGDAEDVVHPGKRRSAPGNGAGCVQQQTHNSTENAGREPLQTKSESTLQHDCAGVGYKLQPQPQLNAFMQP